MSHLATPAAVWIRPYIEPALADLIQVIQDAASPMGASEKRLSEVLIEQADNIERMGRTLEVAGLRSCAVVLDLACQAIHARVRPDMELNDPQLEQVVEVVLWAAFHTSNLVECLSLGNMDDPSYSRKILDALSSLAGREKVQDWELFAPQAVSMGQDHYLDKQPGPAKGFQLGQEVYWIVSRLAAGMASMPGLSSFLPGIATELPRLTQEVQHFSQSEGPGSIQAQTRCVDIMRRILYGLACALRGIDDRQSEALSLPALEDWPAPLRDVVQVYGLSHALPRLREKQCAQRVISGLNISVVQATVKATRDALNSAVEEVKAGNQVNALHASTIVSSLDFLGLPALAKQMAQSLSSSPGKELADRLIEVSQGLEAQALAAQSANPPVFRSGAEQALAEGLVEKLGAVKSEIQSGVESLSEDEDIPSQLITAQDGVLGEIAQDFTALGLDLPSQYMSQLRAWLSDLGSAQTVPSKRLRDWAQAYAFVEYAFNALLAGHRGAAGILFCARHLLVQAGYDPQPGQDMKPPEYLLTPQKIADPCYGQMALDSDHPEQIQEQIAPAPEPELEFEVASTPGHEEQPRSLDPEVAALAARPDLPAHIRALLEKSLPEQTQAHEETQQPVIASVEQSSGWSIQQPVEESPAGQIPVPQEETSSFGEELTIEQQAQPEDPAPGQDTVSSAVPSVGPVFNEGEIPTLDLSGSTSTSRPEAALEDIEPAPVSQDSPSWKIDFDWSQESSHANVQDQLTDVDSPVPAFDPPLETQHSSGVGEKQTQEPILNIEPFEIPDLDLKLPDFDQQAQPTQNWEFGDDRPARREQEDGAEAPGFEATGVVNTSLEQPVLEHPDQKQPAPAPQHEIAQHHSAAPVGGIRPTPIVPFDAPATVSIDGDMQEVFSEEIGEELISLSEWTPELFVDPVNPDILYNIRKSFHTIKGSGRMVGAASLGEMAWAVESVLNRVLENQRPLSDNVIALVLHAQKMVEQFILSMQGKPSCWDVGTLAAWAWRLEKGEEVESPFPSDIDWSALAPQLPVSEPAASNEPVIAEPPVVSQDYKVALPERPQEAQRDTHVNQEPVPQFEVLPLIDAPAVDLQDEHEDEVQFQGQGVLSLPDFERPGADISIEHVSEEIAASPWRDDPVETTQGGALDLHEMEWGQNVQPLQPQENATSVDLSLTTEWTLSDDIPQPEKLPAATPALAADLEERISALSLEPLEDEQPVVSAPMEDAAQHAEKEEQPRQHSQNGTTKPQPQPKEDAEPTPVQSAPAITPAPEPMRPHPLTQDMLLQGTDWKVLLSAVQDQAIALRSALSSNDLLAARDCVNRQIQALERLGELVLALERNGNAAAARLRSLSARQNTISVPVPTPPAPPVLPQTPTANVEVPPPPPTRPAEVIAVTPPPKKQPFWKRWFTHKK